MNIMIRTEDMQTTLSETSAIKGLISHGMTEELSKEIMKVMKGFRHSQEAGKSTVAKVSQGPEYATKADLLTAKMELKEEIAQGKLEFKVGITKVKEGAAKVKEGVSKAETDLKGEITKLGNEISKLEKEISNVRAELKEDIFNVRTELKEETTKLGNEISKLGNEISRLEVSLNKEISSAQNTTIKWIVSLFFAQMIASTGAIIGILKYFSQ